MAILRAAATASFTLDATSDTLITGLALTPASDNYLLFATVESQNAASGGTESNIFSVYVGGSIISHTERNIQEETSLDGDRVTVALNARISPNGSQAVEIRHRASGSGTPQLAFRREMVLFPEPDAGTHYEDTDTANDTLATATWTTLASMSRTPVADDYYLLFSCDAEGPSDVNLGFRVEVGGSEIAHTHRQFANENSLPNTPRPLMIACKVSPNGSQVVEIAWSRVEGTGTITCHKRAMQLIAVDSADIIEASDTVDDARSATGEVLIDSMTIADPGANDWMMAYSASNDVPTVANGILTTYSIRSGGTKVTDSDRRNDHEGSTDAQPLPVLAGGRVTVAGATDDLEMFWDNSVTTTFTQKQRTFVGIREVTVTAAAITDVDSDYGAASDEFDVDENVLDVNGTNFEAVQGTGTVWLADETTLAASNAEVDLAAAIGTWGDTEIILNLNDLSGASKTNVETLIVSDGPALFIILVNDSAEETSLPVTVHRAKAFAMVLSANIATSGENTTGQLTAPASGSFGGGRIQDDENPADTVDVGDDEYLEDEWCIEALANSVLDETYLFRVLIGASPAGTITVTPGLTVEVGGTLFFQTVTGAITPTGVSVKQTLKALAGANTPVGVISRDTLKLVAGSVTPAGGVVKQTLKVLAGVVTPSGALTRATLFSKAVTGALTPTGAIIKEAQKSVAGSLTPAGAITVRDIFKGVAGVVTPTGAVVKLTSKLVDGAVTPSGALASASIFFRSVAGALAPAGAIIKQAQKKVAGLLTPVGAITVRDIFKVVSGVVTPTGGVVKRTSKLVDGAVTPTGVLTAITIFVKAIAGALTPTGAIIKQVQKKVAGLLTPTGAITSKDTQKNVAGAVTPTGDVVKETRKLVDGAVTPTSILATITVFTTAIVGALTPSGTVVKQTEKSIAGAVGPVGVVSKKTTKIPFLGSVTPASILQTGLIIGKSIAGALTPTGGLSTVFTPGSAGDKILRKMLTAIGALRHRSKKDS